MDYVAEESVNSPAGRIDLSIARHADGTLSLIAWLTASQRRVGYLHLQPGVHPPSEPTFDPSVATPALQTAVQRLLERVLRPTEDGPPLGQRLVTAGLLTDDEVYDLLGWQWLLAEIGDRRTIGELAAAALCQSSCPAGPMMTPRTAAGELRQVDPRLS